MDPRLRNHRNRQLMRSMMNQDASVAQNPDAAAIGFIQKVSQSILGIHDLNDTEALLGIVLDLAEQLVRKRQREHLMAQNQSPALRGIPTVSEGDLKRDVQAMDAHGSSHETSAKADTLLASLESQLAGEEPNTNEVDTVANWTRKSPPQETRNQRWWFSHQKRSLPHSRMIAQKESVREKLERLRQIAKEFK